MENSSHIITLTTDFGISDVYVGVMKGVILNINPNAQVVDLTHAIPPQDVYEAALSIHSAYRFFRKGTIHVIVVDPGVGSSRQAIVCQTDSAFFVCPNNGVLSYLLQDIETEETYIPDAVVIENPTYLLPRISNTFHGRDIFAPVAAHLSLGVPLVDIGTPIQDFARLSVPAVNRSDNMLVGQIIKVDSFGNVVTNISEEHLAAFLLSCSPNEITFDELYQQVDFANYEITAGSVCLKKLNSSYSESEVGEPLAIISSFGLLEIAVNLGNASARFGLKKGDSVVVRRGI
jgi:S-adenosylmethionine hydrolase